MSLGMCRRIAAEPLRAFVTRAFEAAGLPARDAGAVAELMVQADARGSDTHGVIRLPLYVRRIRAGGINPRPNIRVVSERPAAALVDGDNAMGHLVMRFAAETAIDQGEGRGRRLGGRAHEQSRRAGRALRHHAARARYDRALPRGRRRQSPAAVGRQRDAARHQPGRRRGARRWRNRRSCSIWRRRWRRSARCG